MSSRPSRFRVAWTAGRLASRRLLRREEGEADAHLGDLLAGQLDEMKGLAMKLGQIVSYMDVPLPASVQQQLARLQTGVQGMGEAETRAALAHALGPNFESRFESFEWKPIAAASIGQVHRARFAGRDIALKVQYPEVATSFRRDLGALKSIASLASAATAVDGPAVVAELGARLAEECDYEREARFQVAFAAAFPTLDIPGVVAELSTKTTLASEWAEGSDFGEIVGWPADVRNRIATELVRFSYGSLFNLATVQADPHPGNFRFRDDGRVTFLDFGCVRRFETDFVSQLRAMVVAIDTDTRSAFREATVQLGMAPKPTRFDFDYHFKVMEHLHRPLLADRFEFTPEFVRDGLALNGPSNPNARRQAMPPAYVWVARLQWGLWSLLSKLGARVTVRPHLDEILAEPIVPLG